MSTISAHSKVQHRPALISTKPIKQSISSVLVSGLIHPQSKRRFRGGLVLAMSTPGSVQKSKEEWRAILSPEQFRILRQKGTEYPGTGLYNKFFEEGIYSCAGCGTPLYRSTTKFNSGCGWPAFYEGLPGAINRTLVEDILVMFSQEKGSAHQQMKRHCVNSISLKFVPANADASK